MIQIITNVSIYFLYYTFNLIFTFDIVIKCNQIKKIWTKHYKYLNILQYSTSECNEKYNEINTKILNLKILLILYY